MRTTLRHAALGGVAVLLLLGACERSPTGPDDSTVKPGETAGTFTAVAGSLSGGGYERLEGTALFEVVPAADGRPVFVLRLFSTLSLGADTSAFDLALIRSGLPAPGVYPAGDPSVEATDFTAHFAARYRSPILGGDVYRSEAGTVTVTTAGAGRLKGTFEITVFTEVPTGPTSSVRRRLPVTGLFHAEEGETGIDPDDLF